MKFFLDFIRSRIITLVCIIIAAVIFAVVLSLYNLPSEPVLYALLLSLAAVTAIGAVTFIKAYRKHNILTRLANEITVSADNLPKAVSADDKDYGRLINTLSNYCISLKEKSANSLQATNEYYTMWVHQIKTPISAMRLMLQSEDSKSNRRLSFIIEQLLSNAIKYTAKGSVSIYMKPDTDRKILCIADTGIGIDPADLPRIFDNGYTGLNGRYDMKASGIGLYLCRCIADMLGITLTAVSELGKGSVFMLDLTESKIRHE